jgi:hypothetical protein
MRALTICQPYAELIMRREKLVENRNWGTHYRGALLIHAGKSRAWLSSFSPLPDRMDYGTIIGVVQVRGCIAFHPGKRLDPVVLEAWPWLDGHVHCEGPFCWILEDAYRFAQPVAFRGMQGIFDVPAGLVAVGLSEAMEARKGKTCQSTPA